MIAEGAILTAAGIGAGLAGGAALQRVARGWFESETPRLHLPTPTWGKPTVNAHIVGTATVAGRPVWVVSFVNPSVPAWFTAWIDRSNYHTLRLRMTAASHFMLHRYLEFDRPLGIKPPSTK